MSFLTQLINEIEGELSQAYWPGAINWCDENFDGAWSKAIDRFDLALADAGKRNDPHLAKTEADKYRHTILGLMNRYKEHKRLSDKDSFMSTLKMNKESAHAKASSE